MRYKISWFIALLLPIVIFFLFSCKTFKEISCYFLLNQKTKAIFENYEIKNDNKNKFKAFIYYSFKINDKTFKNKTFSKSNFLNSMNANDFINNFLKNDFYVWYNEKNPNISSLEKKFPIKNCIYVTITFLIFIYFLILKYYVYRFQKIN